MDVKPDGRTGHASLGARRPDGWHGVNNEWMWLDGAKSELFACPTAVERTPSFATQDTPVRTPGFEVHVAESPGPHPRGRPIAGGLRDRGAGETGAVNVSKPTDGVHHLRMFF